MTRTVTFLFCVLATAACVETTIVDVKDPRQVGIARRHDTRFVELVAPREQVATAIAHQHKDEPRVQVTKCNDDIIVNCETCADGTISLRKREGSAARYEVAPLTDEQVREMMKSSDQYLHFPFAYRLGVRYSSEDKYDGKYLYVNVQYIPLAIKTSPENVKTVKRRYTRSAIIGIGFILAGAILTATTIGLAVKRDPADPDWDVPPTVIYATGALSAGLLGTGISLLVWKKYDTTIYRKNS